MCWISGILAGVPVDPCAPEITDTLTPLSPIRGQLTPDSPLLAQLTPDSPLDLLDTHLCFRCLSFCPRQSCMTESLLCWWTSPYNGRFPQHAAALKTLQPLQHSGIVRNNEKRVHVPGWLRIQRNHLDRYCLQVVAEDVDSKPNGDVLYTIIAGNQGNQFSIDPTSGIIRVNKELDRESVSNLDELIGENNERN